MREASEWESLGQGLESLMQLSGEKWGGNEL